MAYIDEVQIEKGQSSTKYTLRDKETNELLSHVVGVVTNLYWFEGANKNTILTLSGTSSNAEWDTSHYIPVEPGKQYKFQWRKTAQDGTEQWDSGETRYLFYTTNNAGGAIIDTEQTAPNSGLANGAIAPAGAKYLRVSIRKVYKPSGNADAVAIDASAKGVVAETALFPDEYCAHDTKIYRYADDLVTTDELNAGLALKANVSDVTSGLEEKADASDVAEALALKADKSEYETDIGRVLVQNPENLYDPDKRQVNARFKKTGNVISIDSSTTNDISGYIPVEPGSTYIGKVLNLNAAAWATGPYQSGELYVLYSAKDENAYVSSGAANELIKDAGVTIPANSNIAYMRVVIRKNSIANAPIWAVITKKENFPTGIPSECPKPYKFVDELVLSDELDDRVTSIEEDLQTKASKIGSEPQLVAGMSEMLIPTNGREDNEPYSIRAVDSKDKIVSIKQITGGTVAWHQLAHMPSSYPTPNEPIHLSSSAKNATFSGAGYNYTTYAHKYLVTITVSNAANGGSDKFGVQAVGISIPAFARSIENGSYATIVEGNPNGSVTKTTVYIYLSSSASDTAAMDVTNVQLFDLTQMFGATVAQHFLDLETATPGAGVALFRQMFPDTYYPYNAGELVSVQTSGRKTVGFNQWDEEWEVGTINSVNGRNISSALSIRAKNQIPVLAGKTYCLSSTSYHHSGAISNIAVYYDASGSFVSTVAIGLEDTKTFTVPQGVSYMRFVKVYYIEANGTYKHDICLNISDPTRDGTYEPYSAHTYPLDSTLTLRGIPVLTDGVPAYDGDEYAPDGTVTRRIRIVTLDGTTNALTSTYGAGATAIPAYKSTSYPVTGSDAFSPTCVLYSGGDRPAEDYIRISTANNVIALRVNGIAGYGDGTSYADAGELRAAANAYLAEHPVTVVYATTPSTETAAPYQEVQIAGSTEEFLNSPIPVGSVSLYQTNLREGLEKVLTSISSSGLEYPYAFLKDDKTLTIDGAAADAKATGDAFEAVYTKIDETQELGANQLLSETGTQNPTPYTYRENASGSDRVTISQITGWTVAWNQLAPNNWSQKGRGRFAFPAGTRFVNGHRYLIFAKRDINTESIKLGLYTNSSSGNVTIFDIVSPFNVDGALYVAVIRTALSDGLSDGTATPSATGGLWGNISSNTDTTVSGLQIFDLTQMFGSAVADYIYGLETATAGAGVALFRTMFPESYYPYNAGELLSVQTSGRKTVGFNKWDGEYEADSWIANDGTYAIQTGAAGYNVTSYIPVIGGGRYYHSVNGSNRFLFYNSSKTPIPGTDGSSITTSNAAAFTVPVGAAYMRATVTSRYLSSFIVNISDPARNGQYEPYSGHTYPLDSTLTLRGVPVRSSGVPAYDGDKYAPDGTVTRRYGIVDLGTLTWNAASSAGRVKSASRPTNIKYSNRNDIIINLCLCSKAYVLLPYYITGSSDKEAHGVDQSIAIVGSESGAVFVHDTSLADKSAAEVKAALSGVYLVYELATPTTETAAPYQEIQIAGSTEEFLPPATDTRPAAVPVGSVSLYQTNLREGLEKVLTSIESAGLEYPYDFSTVQGMQETVDNAVNAAGYPYAASGSLVTIHPVADSRIDFVAHIDPVQAAPSNLAMPNSSIFPKTIGGVTYTYDGAGTITANGTNTGTSWQTTELQFATVTLSPGHYYFKGCPSGGGTSTYRTRIFSNAAGFSVYEDGSGVEFDVTQEIPNAIIRFSPAYGAPVTFTNTKIKPVLYSYDPSPNNVRPIIAPESVTVTRAGSNLAKIAMYNNDDVRVHNGITFTRQSDGSVKVTGTASGASAAYSSLLANTSVANLVWLPAGTYCINQSPGAGLSWNIGFLDENKGTVQFRTANSADMLKSYNIYSTASLGSRTITLPTGAYAYFRIMVGAGNTIDTTCRINLVAGTAEPGEWTPSDTQSVTVTLPSGTYGGDYDSHGTFAPMRFATLTSASKAGANAGSIAGQLYISNGSSQAISTSGIMDVKRFFCSLYKVMPYAAPEDRQDGCIYFGNSRFYIYDAAHMTSQDSAGLDAYFSWLDSVGGLSICAPYDPNKAPAVTAVDAKALRATSTAQTNNVWTDNGKIDVSGATDLSATLETLLDTDLAHAESIAPVHGSTASTNIASGELLMQNGTLYKTTQAIVSGAEITPGTNATQTNLAEVITQVTTVPGTVFYYDSLSVTTTHTLDITLPAGTYAISYDVASRVPSSTYYLYQVRYASTQQTTSYSDTQTQLNINRKTGVFTLSEVADRFVLYSDKAWNESNGVTTVFYGLRLRKLS